MSFVNRFTAEIDPDSKAAFDRAFNRLDRELDDATAVFEAAADLHYRWTYDQFFTEGAAGGTPWPDLSPAYEERKLNENPFALMILQRTQAMHLSFIRQGYDNNVHSITPKEAVFGSLDPKARWHHTGAGRNPVRTILTMNDRRRTELTKAIQGVLLKMVRGTGLGTFAAESRAEGF